MENGSKAISGIPQRRASAGKAAVFTLTSVDRVDHPGGAGHGRPGGSSAQMLGCEDTGGDLEIAEVFKPRSKFILYAIEDLSGEMPILVFLEMPSIDAKDKLIREEAFIDRCARQLVAIGSQVLVTSLESAETFIKEAALGAPIEENRWNLTLIWNTGRCGSTLMHKVLLSLGVGSFSEPQWLDQLCFTESGKVDPALLTRAFKACWLMDIHLLRALPAYQEATKFSLNFKTSSWIEQVGGPVVKAFPSALHCFMYRACDKVVQSFTGLDAASVPEEKIAAENARWKQNGPSMVLPMFSESFKPIADELPLASIEDFGAARRTASWLNCLNGWRKMQEASDDFSKAPVIRMDEYVSKDLAKREAVLVDALLRLGVIESRSDVRIQAALETFNEDSQKGSAMSSGKRQEGLSEKSRGAIMECVAKAGPLISGLVVENQGANVVLPGSLGVSLQENGPFQKAGGYQA